VRLRWIWLSLFVVMAVLAAYYAGYRRGISVGPERAVAVAPHAGLPAAGESDRARPRGNPPASIGNGDAVPLLARDLTMPLDGVKQSDILDTFNQGRSGGRRHEATDIMAPRGARIRAIGDGTIKKLFLSKAGGNTIYEFDPQGVYCYYYAHLDRYAEGLKEGMTVKKGDLIGYVGSTGDADAKAPHLHFAIFRLGPDKKWWQGEAVNPYPVLSALAGGR
jgi:peptidoglycan LD-endopeptidase LytH